MQIFVINLEKDGERRESIKSQLDDLKLPFEFFPGVLGSSLSAKELTENYDDVKAKRHLCMALVPAQIGCSLSHTKVYREIIKRKLPCALILEDDVVLPKSLPDILREFSSVIDLARPEVILLSPAECILHPNYRRKIGINYHILPFKSGFYTSSYIVTNPGARALLTELFPVWNFADCWNQMKLYKVVDIFAISPALVVQDQTTFGSSTTDDTMKILKALNMGRRGKLLFKCRRAWSKLVDFFYAFYRRNFVPYAGIFRVGNEFFVNDSPNE